MTERHGAAHDPGALSAIVLAGGRSSRLGGIDKPTLELGGATLLARVVGAARDVGADPIVVVGRRQDDIDANWAQETPRFGGPAAAIAAGVALLDGATARHGAIAAAPSDRDCVLVLAADLRRPTAVVGALLAAEPGADGALLADSGGRAQWLCGLYRRAALAAALKAVGDPTGVSMGRLLGEARLARHPIADDIVADIDTPADARDAGIAL